MHKSLLCKVEVKILKGMYKYTFIKESGPLFNGFLFSGTENVTLYSRGVKERVVPVIKVTLSNKYLSEG